MQRAPRRGAVTIFHGRDIIYQSRAYCRPDMQAMFDDVAQYLEREPTGTFSLQVLTLTSTSKNHLGCLTAKLSLMGSVGQSYIKLHVKDERRSSLKSIQILGGETMYQYLFIILS